MSPTTPDFATQPASTFPVIQERVLRPHLRERLPKRLGIVAEGTVWNNAKILNEHLQLREQFPEARLLWSGDWSTFDAPDFWVTIAGDTFQDADGALAWCTRNNLDRDHCYAKIVRTTHPVKGSTRFQ